VQAVTLDAGDAPRVVGEQADRAHAEVGQHLGAEAEVAQRDAGRWRRRIGGGGARRPAPRR
jgi:hypothetical protein